MEESRIVCVRNLPLLAKTSHLITFFKEVGRVVDCHMTHGVDDGILDSTCYVEFESERVALQALLKSNGNLLDQVVHVERTSGDASLRELKNGPTKMYILPIHNESLQSAKLKAQSALKKYGNILAITSKKVIRRHSRDYKAVTVTFERRSSALKAMGHKWPGSSSQPWGLPKNVKLTPL